MSLDVRNARTSEGKASEGGYDPILRPDQAAAYTGVARSTLAKRRLRGNSPRFLKLGARSVGYRKSDLDEWLASCLRTSTSDSGGET